MPQTIELWTTHNDTSFIEHTKQTIQIDDFTIVIYKFDDTYHGISIQIGLHRLIDYDQINTRNEKIIKAKSYQLFNNYLNDLLKTANDINFIQQNNHYIFSQNPLQVFITPCPAQNSATKTSANPLYNVEIGLYSVNRERIDIYSDIDQMFKSQAHMQKYVQHTLINYISHIQEKLKQIIIADITQPIN